MNKLNNKLNTKIIDNIFKSTENKHNEINKNQEITKNKNLFELKPKFIIFAIIIISIFAILIYNSLDTRQLKKAKELERIFNKPENCKDCCIQYALIAASSGWFVCYSLQCDGGLIWLNKNEVWKYGKTCSNENIRYGKGRLAKENLFFDPEFTGTEKECLMMEKEKIYSYSKLPECINRGFILLRPPGNKIDR